MKLAESTILEDCAALREETFPGQVEERLGVQGGVEDAMSGERAERDACVVGMEGNHAALVAGGYGGG